MPYPLTRKRPPIGRTGHRLLPVTAFALAAALVAVVAGGCGTTQPPASAAPPITSTSGSSDPAATSGAADTSAPSDPLSDGPTAGPTAQTSADLSQFCKAISLNLAFLTTAAGSPDDPSLQHGVAAIRKLVDIAPVEIKSDLRVIADFDQDILDQIRAGRRPEIKETPELTAALTHEAKWTAEHCTR